MNSPARLGCLAALGAALAVVAGCGANPRAQLPAPAAAPVRASAEAEAPAQAPAPPAVDPIDALLASSNRHFDAGQQELALGHLGRARQEFNAALDVLIDSPYGGRNHERIRAQFDRLVIARLKNNLLPGLPGNSHPPPAGGTIPFLRSRGM